jgi:hypothetical protein
MLADKNLRSDLFYQASWLKAWADTDTQGAATLNTDELVAAFEFSVVEDELGVSMNGAFVRVANFYVVRVLKTFVSVNGSCAPWSRILCRTRLGAAGPTVYLAAKDECRAPDLRDARYLDVELDVDVGKLKSPSEVTAMFKMAHPNLRTTLTVAQFACYINHGLEHPAPTACVAYLGRQPCGVFVAGNCCFQNGSFISHDEAQYAIVPDVFADHLVPVPREDFPYHIQIPFPIVRYVLLTRAWHELLPAFFKNNTMPAKAMLASTVMGLQASKIWDGQTGTGHGCPFVWAYSTEPGTGKTEASLLCQSVIGFNRRAPWAGDATKPALFERFSQQRDLTCVVDDVVVNSGGDSKTYAQLGRTIFDQTTRAVMGKSRKPLSSAIFTVRAPHGTPSAALCACAPTRA